MVKTYGSIKKPGSYKKVTVKSGVVGKGGGIFSPSGKLLSKVLPSVLRDKTPSSPPIVTKFIVRSGVVGKEGGLFTSSGKQLSKTSRDIDEEATAKARLQKEIEVRQAGGRGTRLPGGFSGVAPNIQRASRQVSVVQKSIEPQRIVAEPQYLKQGQITQVQVKRPTIKLSKTQQTIQRVMARARTRIRKQRGVKKKLNYYYEGYW